MEQNQVEDVDQEDLDSVTEESKDPRFVSFPSIFSLSKAIATGIHRATYVGKDENDKPVYDSSKLIGKNLVHYTGTVKLHGGNAAVVKQNHYNDLGERVPHTNFSYVHFQSRNSILSEEKDLFGFRQEMSRKDRIEWMSQIFIKLVTTTWGRVKYNDTIAIFGEWCGGSIQKKKIAIRGESKFWMIFAIRIIPMDGSDPYWLDTPTLSDIITNKELGIYWKYDFPHYNVNLDLSNPEEAREKIINATLEVEKLCPVAKSLFDKEGVGEGIVWMPNSFSDTSFQTSEMWFKSKGHIHEQNTVRVLSPIEIEKIANAQEFAQRTCSPNRLEQGIEWLTVHQGLKVEMRNIGAFIKWVYQDILKEEEETLKASGSDRKDVSKPISSIAKKFFVERCQGNDD